MSEHSEDLRESSATNARSSRRRLITGGALAAGVAAGGVLLSAAPHANAAPGDPILQGRDNIVGPATTKLQGRPDGALLYLRNGEGTPGSHALFASSMGGYGIAGQSEMNFGLSGTTTAGADKAGVLAINNAPAGKGAGLIAHGRKNSGAIITNADSASPALLTQSTASGAVKPIAFRATAGTLSAATLAKLKSYLAAAQVTSDKGPAFHAIASAFGPAVVGETAGGGPAITAISPATNIEYGAVEGTGYLGGLFQGAGNGIGVVAIAGNGASSLAIKAHGNVNVEGTITSEAAASVIDHPLKPSEQYLSHAFVESPEMKTVHDGVVTANSKGEAIVELPDWFDAVNKDFRYQLTPIGKSAPTLYVRQEVENNTFKIAGANPGQKVSWQLTGVRKDVWAEQNRVQVERDKKGAESGTYLYPQGFGKPASKRLGFREQR